MNEYVSLAEEVADALASDRPVVALESSGVVQGLSYPLNLQTALDMEKAIRAGGAVPARTGIVDGRLVVGMSEAQVELFATTPTVPKISTRDIGPALAGGGHGGTTVSAALVAAARVGIKVFAVAGIGGVHFGAERSLDISADLLEFTRHQIAVVCAGAKSLLDPALTMEYLETVGVPVVGYRCDDFPAYYSVSSSVPNPRRIDDLEELAEAIRLHWAIGGGAGFLVTHPIDETDALPSEEIYALVREVQTEAEAAGVHGPAMTPYILSRVSAVTSGRTAAANRSVLLSTSALAAEVAVAIGERS
ncbi:pseudouridine-5'-phosphate glycosidase [Micromonospora sp. WMMD710]|uniref:pseudouridine-5'-phosphate glycosidase n=1 Tax=Micromonospora sp. WMMD710 TaxID=3016085 RepID=UPI0024160C51|nr:pseudouridine-5'-phosphate glycosidase [Micromonospora sp. WMMD710]MDG4757165.1 pseudouridine-5'-phosphate glycosidase [Micromonospora sp. WMMD710]